MKNDALRLLFALLFTLAMPGNGLAGSMVNVGEHSLFLHCTGDGTPTVVLDAGLGGTHLDWSLVQPDLASTTRVCSYDRAGYGQSELGPSPRNAATLANELEHLLRHPAVASPVVLVSHSLAGFHHRLLAQRNPQKKIVALTLLESAHEDQFDEFMQRAKLRLAPSKGDRIRLSPPAVPKQLPATVRARAQSLAYEQKSLLTLRAELLNFKSSAAQLQQLPDAIEQPLLVVSRGRAQWSKSDDSALREGIWQELQQKLSRLSSQATQVIASDSGHFVHLEQPELVIGLLRGLLEGLRRQDATPHLSAMTGPDTACRKADNTQWHCRNKTRKIAAAEAP